MNNGLHYWRLTLYPPLPSIAIPTIIPDTHAISLPTSSTETAIGFVDSDWDGDTKHCKPIFGICLYFAGAPVLYCSHFQSTISQSSTESKLITTNEAGKLALYLISMSNDLGIPQESATQSYEDNCAAIAMG